MIQFQDNLLKDIDEFATGEYPECTEFALKGNQITKIPSLKMPKLRKIYLNQNEISDVHGFVESVMPDLEMLSL